MRIAAALAIVLGASTAAMSADEKFNPVLHLLTTKGTYEKNYIEGSSTDGMSKIECELRLDAWKAKTGYLLEMATQQLKREGKSTSYRLECERL